MSNELVSIEVHDARVSEVGLRSSGEGFIVFSQLSAFHETGFERYDVRLHAVRLVCYGVHGLTLDGELARDDYVSDGQALDSNGSALPWERLQDRSAVQLVHLQFGSGAELRIDCREVELSLESEGRFLESWEGPL